MMAPRASRLSFLTVLLPAILTVGSDGSISSIHRDHPAEWEDGPASWDEFGHDNDPSVCGLLVLSLSEWDAGRYWEGATPVLVKNVTDGWAALENWKKQEMLRRYPDAEATMGEARQLAKFGPDSAGKILVPTTVKEFVTNHMYDPSKYFFDRKISIPKGMIEDCRPLPMPSRAFVDDTNAEAAENAVWRDHFTISIGADLQGLTFHEHSSAWNTVIFGAKRWILWDKERWKSVGVKKQLQMMQDDNGEHVSSSEWIRTLYAKKSRRDEIRAHGHDCIQHAGDLIYVPHGTYHMVVNIGDTVAVVSEAGLDRGEGRESRDYLFDPSDRSAMRGIGLVNKLLDAASSATGGPRELLTLYLGRGGATRISPNGETADLMGTMTGGGPRVSPGDLVEALSNAVTLIRRFEAAGTTDRQTAMIKVEELRMLAMEAREVLVERYGEESGIVLDFQSALQPVFRRGK